MNYWKTTFIKPLTVLISAILILLSLGNSWSQEPYKATRINQSITFDGVPDEEVWKSIVPMKLIMHSPVFRNEPTESSTVRIAYDNEYLYVSALFNYKDPSTIRAIGKKRDYATPSCDWFGIYLDTYYDRENAVAFFTNPNGIRTEAAIKNDARIMAEDINFSWNTFWDAKTVVKDSCWFSEIRVPFSSLRFQTRDGKSYMGLTIFRFISAKSQEMDTYPAIPPDYQNAFWKPSMTTPVVFENLHPKNPVYLTPYLSSGLSQVNELNEANTEYNLNTTPKFDAGLDLKYSLTNNLTMDVTVNTDFAQVEADDQKINLTRFSLFFPEKRVFFQEKADVFDFSFLGGNNLFYSRRIGIYDGNPVRIYGGLRMTGKVNKWDLGVLDMQTAPYEENPGENFGVFRTKRTVFNQNSYVGGMFTSRLGMNGNYNLAYGLDGQFRVTGDEYLTFRMAQSFENDSLNKVIDLSPSRFMLQWERRNRKGFSYDFVYTYSGQSFNPGIGFEMKDNYQGFRTIFNYGWFPDEDAIIRYHNISLTAFNFWNTASGLQETTTAMVTWLFEGKKGFSGSIFPTFYRENLADTLTLGNDQAVVLPGNYSFADLSFMYATSNSNHISASLMAQAGSFYDGWKVSLFGSPSVNIGSGLNLGLTYTLDYVNFPDRASAFTNHIVGLKGLLTLTTKTSFSAFIQYNTAVDKVMTNIRFRYNPREGNDFYIVYDEGMNTNITSEVPTLPHSSGRTILLKYTYTFIF
jgi:hypothetical protein